MCICIYTKHLSLEQVNDIRELYFKAKTVSIFVIASLEQV